MTKKEMILMSNYKKWKEYGNNVKEVEKLLRELRFNTPVKLPKKMFSNLDLSIKRLSMFKCEMEDEMFRREQKYITKENEQDYLNIFYGSDE